MMKGRFSLHPIPYGYPAIYRTSENGDDRILPVIPFLTGLVVAPFLYGAFTHGGYYSYPAPAYYYHNPYHYYGPPSLYYYQGY